MWDALAATLPSSYWDVTPDIITMAKGLSGGYSPLGAILLAEPVWHSIAEGSGEAGFSNTFGGNPLSCATGSAVLEYIEDHDLVARAAKMGDRLREALVGGIGEIACVGDVRGRGLFLGVELVADRASKEGFAPDLEVPARLNEKFKKHGLLHRAGEGTLVFGPPLCITRGEVDEIVHAIDLSLWELEGEMEIASTV